MWSIRLLRIPSSEEVCRSYLVMVQIVIFYSMVNKGIGFELQYIESKILLAKSVVLQTKKESVKIGNIFYLWYINVLMSIQNKVLLELVCDVEQWMLLMVFNFVE